MSTRSSVIDRRTGAALREARTVVIALHGRGSSAGDIIELADAFAQTDVAWVAPTAESGAWYPHRFLAPLAQNEPALSQALATVTAAIAEVRDAGVSLERVALVGFSQGACLALEYAMRNPARYAFVAALSGALIGPLDLPRTRVDLRQTPVLLGCAEHDAHIPLPHVDQSATFLTESGAQVTKRIFPGAAHTVFREEIAWIDAQLREVERR